MAEKLLGTPPSEQTLPPVLGAKDWAEAILAATSVPGLTLSCESLADGRYIASASWTPAGTSETYTLSRLASANPDTGGAVIYRLGVPARSSSHPLTVYYRLRKRDDGADLCDDTWALLDTAPDQTRYVLKWVMLRKLQTAPVPPPDPEKSLAILDEQFGVLACLYTVTHPLYARPLQEYCLHAARNGGVPDSKLKAYMARPLMHGQDDLPALSPEWTDYALQLALKLPAKAFDNTGFVVEKAGQPTITYGEKPTPPAEDT